MNDNDYLVDFKKFRNISDDVDFFAYINQYKNNKNNNKFNDDLINELITVRNNIKNIKYYSSYINIENNIKNFFTYLNLINKLIKNFPILLKKENQKIKLKWYDSFLNINESSNINLEIMSIKFNLAVLFFNLGDSLENNINDVEKYDENEIFDLHTIKRYYRISAYFLEQIIIMSIENNFNTLDFNKNYLNILKNYSLAKAQNIIYIIVKKLKCNQRTQTEIYYGVYYYYTIIENDINKVFKDKCELDFSIFHFLKIISSSQFKIEILLCEAEKNSNKIHSYIELIKKGFNDLDSLLKNDEFKKLKKEIDKRDEIENNRLFFCKFLDKNCDFLDKKNDEQNENLKKNNHYFQNGFKVESLNIENMTQFIISKNYEIKKLKNEIKNELNEYLLEKEKEYQIEEYEKFIDSKFLPNLVEPYVTINDRKNNIQNNNNEIGQELLEIILKTNEKYNYFKIDILIGKLKKLKDENKNFIEELLKKIKEKNIEFQNSNNNNNNNYDYNDLKKYLENLNYYSSKFEKYENFIEQTIQLYEKNKDIYILFKDSNSLIEKYKNKYSNSNLLNELKMNKSNEFNDLYENSVNFRNNLNNIKNIFKIIKQDNNDKYYFNISSLNNESDKESFIQKKKSKCIDESLKLAEKLFEELNINKNFIQENFINFYNENYNKYKSYNDDIIYLTKIERIFNNNINLVKKGIEKLDSLKNKLELFKNELDGKFETFYFLNKNQN